MATGIDPWYVFSSPIERKLMVVRIDPISSEIDKDTQYILDHLKWTSKMGPQRETYPATAEDVLIDITIPPSQDI